MFYITEFFGLFNKKSEPFEKFYTIPPKYFFKSVRKDQRDVYMQTLQKIMDTPDYKCLVMAAIPSNNLEGFVVAGICGIETGPIKKEQYRKIFFYVDVNSGANLDYFLGHREMFSSVITSLREEIKKEGEDLFAMDLNEYNFGTMHYINLRKVNPMFVINIDTFEVVKKLR